MLLDRVDGGPVNVVGKFLSTGLFLAFSNGEVCACDNRFNLIGEKLIVRLG